MALCIACSSEIHEQEDCPYRDEAAKMRAAGIDITSLQLREMTEAGRRGTGR